MLKLKKSHYFASISVLVAILGLGFILGNVSQHLIFNAKNTVVYAKHKKVTIASSHEELKTVVSSPMTKDNYQTLENGLLAAAKYDDIKDPSNTGARQRFNSRQANIEQLTKTAKKTLKSEKKFLTTADYHELKAYTKTLRHYLTTLHDYATIYQTDVPPMNDPNTDSDTVTALKQEVAQSQTDFQNAKTAWLNSYYQLMQ